MAKRKKKRSMTKSLDELERYKALGQMIGGFVHQLRTPIHVIQSNAEDLAGQNRFMPNFKPQAEMIARNAQRLEATVNALLSFVKGEKLPLHPAPLNETVDHLYGFLKHECQKRHVTLEKKLASQQSIMLDEYSLQEALINFIMNALQAMPKGGTLTIVSEDLPGRKVQLQIRDTGSGMDSKTLAKLNTPFHTTKKGGVGLGVFFARKVLQRHHAKLTLLSKKGQGTTVRMIFPGA